MRSLFSAAFVTATIANLCFFTSVTTFFVMPVQLEQLGATRAEIGHIMGVFGATSVVAIPLTGALVDRYGRRLFMVLGGALWAALALAYSTVEVIGWLPYAVRLGQGVAFSLAFVATSALVVDLAPVGALGRAIAVFGTTTLVTHAIGPAAGEVIAERYGFRTLYQTSTVIALLSVVAYLAIREPERAVQSQRSRRAGNLLRLAKRPGARGVLVAGVTSALAFGVAINFMPIFVRARGLTTHAPFFGAYVAMAVAVRLLAGGLGDRFGHRRVGATALLLFAFAVAGFSTVHTMFSLVGFAALFGLMHGSTYPSLNALFVRDVPPAARGRAMALFTLSFNIGITTAAFVGGEVAERWGYSAMWLGAGLLCWVGVLALFADNPARYAKSTRPAAVD